MNGEGDTTMDSASGNRRGSRRVAAVGQDTVGIPGGDGPAVSVPSWRAVDPDKLGAEEDLQVRAGDREATARLNGHGQWISAETRRLLDWTPLEVFH